MEHHNAASGPEARALLNMRRWLIVLSAGGLAVFCLVFAIPHWWSITDAERALLLGSVLLITSGIAMSARPRALWLCACGLGLIAASALVPTEASPQWIPLGTIMSYLTYAVVVLLPSRVGLIAVAAGTGALAFTWAEHPVNAIAGSLGVLGGWPQVIAIGVAGVLLWWAWNQLLAEATSADARLQAAERGATSAIMQQERLALWRETATRVHESVLNTIRYVLTAQEIDSRRLADELRADAAAPIGASQVQLHDVTEVVDAVCADRVAGGAIRVVGTVPSVTMDHRAAEALRAALVELARNALRHGGATVVRIHVSRRTDGQLRCHIEHDGTAPAGVMAPGLGIGTVLEGALVDAGGGWTRNGGTSTTVAIWPHRRRVSEATTATFDRGRLLITAPLAGLVAGGLVGYAQLARTGDGVERLAAVAGAIAVVQCLIIVRQRRHLDLLRAMSALVAPGIVPWLLQLHGPNCSDITVMAPALNTSGLAVLVAATWSRALPGIAGTTVWATGGLLVVASMPSACQPSALVPFLNSLVAAPLIIAVSSSGARAYERAQSRARAIRHREFVERSRAAAASDVTANLHGAVRSALECMERVARVGAVDAASRSGLEIADGRIRAALQVDPRTAGGMASLARRLVERLAEEGKPVQVRAIACSRDARPVPADLETLLRQAAARAYPVMPQLHAFTDGVEDYLSLLLPASALSSVGLRAGIEMITGDVRLELDEDADERGRIALLVSRAVLAASDAIPTTGTAAP